MDAKLKRNHGRLDRSRQAAPQIFETLRDRILTLAPLSPAAKRLGETATVAAG